MNGIFRCSVYACEGLNEFGGIERMLLNVSPSDAWSVSIWCCFYHNVIITDTCNKCKLQIESFFFPPQ